MADELYADTQLAALYDRLYPGAADFGFYLPLVMAAQCVLDVGCGTGALLHAARARGHAGRLCGLDPAEAMLAQARARGDIDWIRADLASAGWIEEFDLVVMTGHVFQVFVADSELRAALAAVRRVLKPHGRFAFDTRNPAARAWESWPAQAPIEVEGPGGERIRLTRQVLAPFDGRTVTFTETFSAPGWSQPRLSRSTLRFLDATQLGRFLAEAGFTIEAQFGGFAREPLTPRSAELVTIARPALKG
ncbi:MAG TPA: methyltransferase domain-containing protein [Steroidobacteraceae bacterium]|nr:methyltransferase domain-containing protein [Steroidobacteraceae bacterium]